MTQSDKAAEASVLPITPQVARQRELYEEIQRSLRCSPELIQPMWQKDVFNGVALDTALTFIRHLAEPFNVGQALRLLGEHSFEECRAALYELEPRLNLIRAACSNFMGMMLARQIVNNCPDVLFQSVTSFLARLENAKHLVSDDRRRTMFLSQYPGYFDLSLEDVQRHIADGTTLDRVGGQIDRLWLKLTGAAAPLPSEIPAGPIISNLQRRETVLPSGAGATITALPVPFGTSLIPSPVPSHELALVNRQRTSVLQRMLTEEFGMTGENARHILATRSILLTLEPATLRNRIRESLNNPLPAKVDRLLRRHGTEIANGTYQPLVPKPVKELIPPDPLRALLRSIGFGPHTARAAAKRVENAHKLTTEAAVAYIERLKAAGCEQSQLFTLLRTKSPFLKQSAERPLELQQTLETDCGMERAKAWELVVKNPCLLPLTPPVLMERIDAAIGTRDARMVEQLLQETAPTISVQAAEELQKRRAAWAAQGVNTTDQPEALKQMPTVPEAPAPAEVVEPPPVVAQKPLEVQPPTRHDPHTDALTDAGWVGERAIVHLNAYPFLRKMDSQTLFTTVNALNVHLGLRDDRFTRLIRRNAEETLKNLQDLRAVGGSAMSMKLDSTPEPPPAAEDEFRSFILDAHRLTVTTIEKSMELLVDTGFDELDAGSLLTHYPELLMDGGRPLRKLREFIRQFGQDRKLARTLLEEPEERAVLFERSERFDVRECAKSLRHVIKAGRESLPRLKCELLDFTHRWSHLYFPAEEFAFRLCLVDERAHRISLVYAEHVRAALFAPTRLAFTDELGAILRSTELLLKESVN